MKATIKKEDKDNEERTVTLSDEDFNVAGWVDVCIGGDCENVHITELYPAAAVLHIKYQEEKRLENV